MLRQISKRIKQGIWQKTSFLRSRIQAFSEQSNNMAMINQWPLGDLFDPSGFIEKLKDRNKKDKIQKLSGEQGENELQKNLQITLGKNYQLYEETIHTIETSSHKSGPIKEYQVSSLFNKMHNKFSRLFSSQEDIQRTRELEDPQGREAEYYCKEDLNQDSDDYPFQRLSEFYKPDEFCRILKNNQLNVYNIPLNVDEKDIKEYLKKEHNIQVQNIEINRCVLNLNSFATLTVDNRDETVEKLHRKRFNGCLLEVKTNKDSDEESASNRTLVIMNLDKNLSYQEILHLIGQYGRIHNFVIPQDIFNDEWVQEDELMEKLKLQSTNEIFEIEIYDVEKNTTDIKYWPSEEIILEQLKQFPRIYDANYEQTVIDFQEQIDKNEDVKRLYRLYAQQKIKCLRVPKHLRQQFKDSWMPQVKEEGEKETSKNSNLFSDFFNKQYINRGFCIVTFNSKVMAQRALYSITQLTAYDLVQFPLKLQNQPQFFTPADMTHSKQEKYGGKFQIENYLEGNLTDKAIAFKAWEDMELYHIDMAFNISKLEKLRREMSLTRDVAKTKANDIFTNNILDIEQEKERREEIKNKVQEDLNLPNESGKFEDYVKRKNFSDQKDLFETQKLNMGFNNMPGRQFENTLSEQEYKVAFEKMKKHSEKIPEYEQSYSEKIVHKFQQQNPHSQTQKQLIEEREKQLLGENNILQEFRSRIFDKEINDSNLANQKIHNYAELQNALLNKYMKKEGNEQRKLFFANLKVEQKANLEKEADKKKDQTENKKEVPEKQEDKKQEDKKPIVDKPKKHFSTTAITNESYILKQAEVKYQQWMETLKRLLYGNYTEEMKRILFEQASHKILDPFEFNLQFAEDQHGKKYLTEEIIQNIREFDLPESEEQRKLLEQQLLNRKEMVYSIPQDYLDNLRKNAQQGYTQSMIHFIENGIPTEQFKIADDVNAEQMEKDLNKYVAGSGEKYHLLEDELTKEKFIVKSEKPYYKYDYHTISQIDKEQTTDEVIQLKISSIIQVAKYLVNQMKYSQEDAENLVKKMIEKGEYPAELVKHFDELKQQISKENIEQLCDEFGLTKRGFYFLIVVILNNRTRITSQQ